MFKSVLKFMILFIITSIFAAASASTAYIITKKVMNKNTAAPPSLSASDAEYVMAEAPDTPDITSFDFYLVKLDGNNLEVYAMHGNNLEFLYSTSIYAADLGEQDLKLLSDGVKLKDSSALTEFMENYTS